MKTVHNDALPIPGGLPEYQKVWLQDAMACIFKHMENPGFVVADVSDTLGMSERQFYRRIKQLLGTTPNELILQLKMDRAKQLLEEGRFSTVAQVAYAIGFNRSDYFSTVFTKTFGKKPVEFLR
jgi:AraC-like DNA-binding protein